MNEEHIPEIVSINQLCKLMGISRSRFYQLVNDLFLLPPIYSLDSKRPFFTRKIAEQNMSVIKNNMGLNGKVCLFYHTSRRTGTTASKSPKIKAQKKKTLSENNHHQDLIEGLACLGLTEVKSTQIDSVLKELYPSGIQNIDEGEVLKAVYRVIVKQNSTDNVDG